MGGHEVQEEPVEEGRRVVVEAGEAGRIQATPSAETADLGEERPPGDDEGRDRVGQAGALGDEPPGHPGAALGGLALANLAFVRLAVEGGDEGSHEPTALGPEGCPGGGAEACGTGEVCGGRAGGTIAGAGTGPGVEGGSGAGDVERHGEAVVRRPPRRRPTVTEAVRAAVGGDEPLRGGAKRPERRP